MISVVLWFYFYIFNFQRASGVRIFENVLPLASPTRASVFEPQVLSKTCMLKPQKGPCRADITMYYYNNEIKNCTTFEWGGCQGNGNRFLTREECGRTCLSTRGTPNRRPRWCSLTFDYGFCFGAIETYYFDNLWNVCKKTIYSGCGGNKNNFYSRAQCESICLFRNGIIKSETTTKDDKLKKVIIINPGVTWATRPPAVNST